MTRSYHNIYVICQFIYRKLGRFYGYIHNVKQGRYKRPLTSRDFIGLWKEKRYKRNMMFLFARHSAGLLNNNHVLLKLPWLLEFQLHGSQRKSYLSAPFFFHLRCEWLVRGRLYLPNQHHESHHKICNLRYGTHGYLRVLPLVTWIDGFSQSGYCMLHSLGLIKNRTDLFSGFWERY